MKKTTGDGNARMIDPTYLAYQYGDSEKLRIRIETHERYSERVDDWRAQILAHLAIRPGDRVLDAGCGPGGLHPDMARAGGRIVGVDLSPGMVREACEQTARDHLPASILRADVQALPFADASFDAVVAAHVLFHVPDVRRALGELRRVLRPGGRAVISTNAADHSARLSGLHREAAHELGYTPTGGPETLFNLDDLPLVQSVFPTAIRQIWSNAFVFPTVESALRYYATGRVDSIRERQADGSHRPALLAAVGEKIAQIIAAEGAFRVPKDTGCFVALI